MPDTSDKKEFEKKLEQMSTKDLLSMKKIITEDEFIKSKSETLLGS